MSGTLSIDIRDEELLLHPGRAVLWPRRKTLVVADTHFGKSSFFGRHGIPVPSGCDDEDRARLSQLVRASMAERLIVLGDFLHAPIAADSREAHDLDAWARSLAPVQITVVPGNHDRGALKLSWSIEWHDSELLLPPFRFVHDAAVAEGEDSLFTLSGHIHPVRVLSSSKQRLRVPVFWQRTGGLVLPSFGGFTGGFIVSPGRDDHVFAVGPDAVARVRTAR